MKKKSFFTTFSIIIRVIYTSFTVEMDTLFSWSGVAERQPCPFIEIRKKHPWCSEKPKSANKGFPPFLYIPYITLILLFVLFLPVKTTANENSPILFTFYKKHISVTDGNRCAMFPSCSKYAEDALKKHGLFIGWIMTCDRLIRCGRDETKHLRAKPFESNGRIFFSDPVKANDFWWYDEKN
ncbi:conserved hypothetical protein [Desulfamplus magnetovallimortis]|uniref:Membrane protein insertion efficiency factor n=1 Tax=Desulfamplus magnetovallimortis TaxID=1246637 RepID=A0A1W1HLB5_9BACT|nr:membrane protein insertion efficiency factor YidD [Desulfamplus magnetovallimortis]SLM33225.1 conserved hypothetical protein [Desulfamplus magnetovallimortis]